MAHLAKESENEPGWVGPFRLSPATKIGGGARHNAQSMPRSPVRKFCATAEKVKGNQQGVWSLTDNPSTQQPSSYCTVRLQRIGRVCQEFFQNIHDSLRRYSRSSVLQHQIYAIQHVSCAKPFPFSIHPPWRQGATKATTGM